MVAPYRSESPAAEAKVAARQPEVRVLTAAQVRAIRTAMHTFVEEDLAFGRAKAGRRWCARCAAHRPAAGFVAYESGDLCNECATDYELARARGLVWSVGEFLASEPSR
jgi:hypothetical protein